MSTNAVRSNGTETLQMMVLLHAGCLQQVPSLSTPQRGAPLLTVSHVV